MKADFEGEWSDRRQEMWVRSPDRNPPAAQTSDILPSPFSVFIGENLKQIQPLLTAELDACLLDDKEWRAWQVVMRVSFLAPYFSRASR